jgi:ATP-dependent HslUV protease ATP-binding subunit HslU
VTGGDDPLTPSRVVAELDRYVVGQDEAKRAVAVALRNRLRRERVTDSALREDMVPKNILMIGPTGVGKTELARRLAALVRAPFVKVEATRFTEVGYVGRDVESMVKDLVEASARLVRREQQEKVAAAARAAADDRLVELLVSPPPPEPEPAGRSPLEALFGAFGGSGAGTAPATPRPPASDPRRDEMRARLAAGELEEWPVDVDVPEAPPPPSDSGPFSAQIGDLREALGGMLPPRRRRRRLPVREARPILEAEETSRRIDEETVSREAVRRAETLGIIFLDELDKVAMPGGHGPDVSREGVQRDLLPIVEGTTVSTRYGPVKTDHVLFIGAGAFHVSKPSDLIPEMQGRFPIRVELTSLHAADFRRILTEPRNALSRQYQALLAADGVDLVFADDGIDALAEMAERLNATLEDIGARRLHTLLERCLEGVLFAAPERGGSVRVDRAFVEAALAGTVADRDLARFIL